MQKKNPKNVGNLFSRIFFSSKNKYFLVWIFFTNWKIPLLSTKNTRSTIGDPQPLNPDLASFFFFILQQTVVDLVESREEHYLGCFLELTFSGVDWPAALGDDWQQPDAVRRFAPLPRTVNLVKFYRFTRIFYVFI